MTTRARGQATVELALVLPFVVVVLLAVVQAGLVVRDDVRLTHATRAAGRAAALGGDDATVTAAALGASGLDAPRLQVIRTVAGDTVTVELIYRSPTDVVLVGAVVAPVELRERLTFAVEAGLTR